LILHVGTHKTGTTAIQTALKKNSKAMRAEGFAVLSPPKCLRTLQGISTPRQMLVDQCRETLAAYRAKFPGKRLIVSHEGLSGDPLRGYRNAPAIVKTLLEAFGRDIHVVLFLRRQDEFISSMFVQYLQQGHSWNFRSFRERVGLLNWHRLAKAFRWFDKVSVCEYRSADLYNAGAIHKQFGAVIGSKVMQCAPGTLENVSVDRGAVEVFKLCNPRLNKAERKLLRRILQKNMHKPYGAKSNFFAPGEREEYMRLHATANKKLEVDYGIRF